MNDLDLATEYKLIIAKLRNELETRDSYCAIVLREYGGQTGLEFAQRCSKEATIALMYGLTEEADLIMDIMDAALEQHMGGDV